MPQKLRDVMTPDPKVLPKTSTVKEAAELMRDDDIGDVIVVNAHNKLFGILTDRDIAVRVVSAGSDPSGVKLEDVATKEVSSLGPDASVEEAVRIMRTQAVRRLPVVEDGKPVGVVSLGDLAIDRDPNSALADISAAPPDPATPSAGGLRSTTGGLGKALPAAAAGAGLALTVDYLRNRGKKRSVKVAAKRLRKTGRKLRRGGDKTASEATAQAAKYAAAAAALIRSQKKRMKEKAGDSTAELSNQLGDKSRKLSKGAQRKSDELSKKARRKSDELNKRAQSKSDELGKRAKRSSKELGKSADRKSKELGKRAERKSKEFGEFAEEASKELRKKAREVGKLAERKAEEVKEMVEAGKR